MLDGFGGVGGHERVEDERPAWCSHVFEDVILEYLRQRLEQLGVHGRSCALALRCTALYRATAIHIVLDLIGHWCVMWDGSDGLRVVEYFCE